ncbi:hypothetical protein RvY_07431-2 [Ramazzottius varieornatus]|uniref:Uncharacterized protein n=1 Tax=Ramazzottius varieornatus TaxID=947166 RepID=A0A1D1V887_RAMVA|nr:hypothetical protein RvY_07431-2 [Ramazzottius varieornatus]
MKPQCRKIPRKAMLLPTGEKSRLFGNFRLRLTVFLLFSECESADKAVAPADIVASLLRCSHGDIYTPLQSCGNLIVERLLLIGLKLSSICVRRLYRCLRVRHFCLGSRFPSCAMFSWAISLVSRRSHRQHPHNRLFR